MKETPVDFTEYTKDMTFRQKMFAEHYVKCGNATKAAALAGYSKKNANKLGSRALQNEKVRSYIDLLTKKISNKHILSAAERQELLSKFANDKNENIAMRMKAIEILNKMTGIHLDDALSQDNPFEGLTKEELKKLLFRSF